ncbi:MAG: hypothetical protein K5840_04815 [Eubacterium sp.]|nr:hypothetical protein [Eubacterium sp.]
MNKMIAGIMSLVLITGTTSGSFGITALAADDANDGYNGIITGEYTSKNWENDGISHSFYYTDEYFENSGKDEDDHLRSMSAAFALAAVQDGKLTYVSDICDKIGFTDVTMYDEEDSADAMGVMMAHKNIDGEEVVAVVLRGAYDREWASNFTVGAEGDSEGVSTAAQKVLSELDSYIEDNSIKLSKLWITGYSRGGSVADLMGKSINQNLDKYGITEDDLYDYTFEAPAANVDNVCYENIHNCVDENDPVTYLLPENWGFSNCGVKVVMNTKKTRITKYKASMQSIFSGKALTLDNVSTAYGKIYAGNFARGIIDWITDDEYVSRETYSNKLQTHIANMIELYCNQSDEELDDINNWFNNGVGFKQKLTNTKNSSKLVLSGLSIYHNDNVKKNKKVISDVVLGAYDSTKGMLPFDSDERKTFRDAIEAGLDVLTVPIIMDMFNSEVADALAEYEAGEDLSEYYDEHLEDVARTGHLLSRLLTLTMNIDEIIAPHQTYNYVKLVEAKDSYFTNPPTLGEVETEAAESGDASLTASVFKGTNIYAIIIIAMAAIIACETTVIVKQKKRYRH